MFKSRLQPDFSGSSYTSDFKIATPVATLPGAWWYRVSAGTGQPSVNILWVGEVESLICIFYLSVAARKIVWEDPSLRYTSMLLGCKATNTQTKSMKMQTKNDIPAILRHSVSDFFLEYDLSFFTDQKQTTTKIHNC